MTQLNNIQDLTKRYDKGLLTIVGAPYNGFEVGTSFNTVHYKGHEVATIEVVAPFVTVQGLDVGNGSNIHHMENTWKNPNEEQIVEFLDEILNYNNL